MVTVHDLIEELKEYAPDAPVAFWDDATDGPFSITGKISHCTVLYRVQGVEVPIQHVLVE